jgi:hypothetical protein
MKKVLFSLLASLVVATPVVASEVQSLGQITSVNQLRDVEPSDWAFEALRSLVERYGCIVGYPDRTFRGDRALTRWEFAAGLNACMNQLEKLIQEGINLTQADLDKLKRLAQEFESELAMLGARIDNLEERVAFLEDHQFSTTTKLRGEVIFGLYGVAAGEKDGGEDIARVPALGYRTRLEFNTSFTGKDLLYTRLATGNVASLQETTGTFEGELSYTQPDESRLALQVLFYSFPLGENANIWIEAVGGELDNFTNTLNFLDGDGATGAISAFGTRYPNYFGAKGSGIGMQGHFGPFEWSAGYLVPDAADPSEGNGLFNGAYGAIAQIGFVPNKNFGIAFNYIHGYNTLDTGTGSRRSNFRFFTEDLLGEAVPASNNSYGVVFSWRVWDKLVVGGWGGYTNARTLNTLDGQIGRGSLDIWNWALTLAFPDILKEGAVGGLIVGMQPWVASSSVDLPDNISSEDGDTSIHIEAFYEYPFNDNISFTPGILVITSPDYDGSNAPLVIGTLRTTFRF